MISTNWKPYSLSWPSNRSNNVTTMARSRFWVLLMNCVIYLILDLTAASLHAQDLPLLRRRPRLGERLPQQVKERPDRPGEAAAFRRLQLTDQFGVIPQNGLIRAVEQRRAMTLSPGFTDGEWIWLGPNNVGGRTRAIVMHPSQPNTMWAGSAAGGVWKTTDGGESWTPLTDFIASLAVSTLVVAPNNPDVLFAGTGEGFYNADAIRGAGIFKTTDGGDTWAQLEATADFRFHFVNRLSISHDGERILAATRSGIFISDDHGESWSCTHEGEVLDLDCHPADDDQCIAGSRHGKAFYSRNGGQTWKPAAGLPRVGGSGGRVEMCYATADPNTVYVSLDVKHGQIYRSTDGGKKYHLRSTGINYVGTQGWYDNAIWAGDPADADNVVVGGIDLWLSEAAGANLTKISSWVEVPKSAHADHHIIVAPPSFNRSDSPFIYSGNDGGIYQATNIFNDLLNIKWKPLNNGYGVTQFYGAAGHVASGKIIGGSQDNGTLVYDASGVSGWYQVFGGDGGRCACSEDFLYGEFVFLNIHRVPIGQPFGELISGYHWDGECVIWKPPPYVITDAKLGHSNFIAPFVLDPSNDRRIYGGGRSLWRTHNADAPLTPMKGPEWRAIKHPIGNDLQHNISAVAVAESNSNHVWVGHNNGRVYKTENALAESPTWSLVAQETESWPGRFCTSITITHNNPDRIYVTFGGFTPGNVWKTTDGGETWTDISAGLPFAPIRTLVHDKQATNYLHVGAEVGYFMSPNAGESWFRTNGPTNCPVDELFWMGDDLVAATHGRGIFRFVEEADE